MNKKEKESQKIQKRRKQIRLRLRTLIRMVIFNKAWLKDTGDEKITTNTKRNITLLLRQERKIGLLTVAEKALIRMPVWKRSDEDKRKLVNLMLNLNCFARFPPKIRARLSRVVKFNIVAPGHAIMREGNEPITVYFILTGEVEVSKTVYNPETNKDEQKVLYICGPGDCIGDIPLIVRAKRNYTSTAISDVELLCVYDDDFDAILRPYMEQNLKNKQIALSSFNYFKDWKHNQKFFACNVGLLKQYEPLEVIYYEDKGPMDYVHFVISGECMILQYLKMKVDKKGKKKTYNLVDYTPETSKLFSANIAEKSKKYAKHHIFKDDDESHSSEEEKSEEDLPGSYKRQRKSDFKKFALECGVDLYKENTESFELFNKINNDSYQSSKFKSSKESTDKQYENHFIDVGSFTHGGIFGLGEELMDRVIMARTTVQCLLIPRYYLLEKKQNPGNIWQRNLYYISTAIPSRELLFKDFLATRKWRQCKKKLINEALDSNVVGNPTKLQDIPIICRIVEDVSDDD